MASGAKTPNCTVLIRCNRHFECVKFKLGLDDILNYHAKQPPQSCSENVPFISLVVPTRAAPATVRSTHQVQLKTYSATDRSTSPINTESGTVFNIRCTDCDARDSADSNETVAFESTGIKREEEGKIYDSGEGKNIFR